jgi:hypothetical protein
MSDEQNNPPSNVVDFLKYRNQIKQVEQLAAMPDLSKLGTAELGVLVQGLCKLVLEQGQLVTAIMAELGESHTNHQQMQEQFMFVSTQAFCAIQMLKDKGLCTAQEFHDLWMKTLEEKILKPQGLQSEDSGELVLDEEEPTL